MDYLVNWQIGEMQSAKQAAMIAEGSSERDIVAALQEIEYRIKTINMYKPVTLEESLFYFIQGTVLGSMVGLVLSLLLFFFSKVKHRAKAHNKQSQDDA